MLPECVEQQPGSSDLGTQNGPEAVGSFPGQLTGIDNSGGMDDTGDRPMGVDDVSDRRIDPGRIADINLEVLDSGTHGLQFRHKHSARRSVRQRRTAEQHESCSISSGEVTGELGTDTCSTTGNEVHPA